ncbi:hypothetical protein DFH11DRAFT_1547609 [Phellopilus nigrolimitatus]|nr:hypothetical protein DFH11DRAFT_1547609 [Phellopilus nigrolimitatus]
MSPPSKLFDFDKLTSSNYASWAGNMKAAFRASHSWKLVSGVEKRPRDIPGRAAVAADAATGAPAIPAVSPITADPAKVEAWDDKELRDAKYTLETLDDELGSVALIRALRRDEFSNLRSALVLTTELTMEDMKEVLIAEEAQSKQSESSLAMVAATKPAQPVKCAFCDKDNHSTDTCYAMQRAKEERKEEKKEKKKGRRGKGSANTADAKETTSTNTQPAQAQSAQNASTTPDFTDPTSISNISENNAQSWD